MRRYVLAGYVADESLEPEWIGIHNQAGFCMLPWTAKVLCAKEEAQFERHIESGQAVVVQFDSGDVMYTPATTSAQHYDLVNSGLTGVIELECGAWHEAANKHDKHDSIEQRAIFAVERTVDKYSVFVSIAPTCHRPGQVRTLFSRVVWRSPSSRPAQCLAEEFYDARGPEA